MNWLKRFLTSTIGLKVIMALTGVVLVGFVIVHMLGNLQIHLEFLEPGRGATALDEYAKMLHSNKLLLWGARVILLTAVFGHLYSALVLTRRASSARPVGYEKQTWFSGSYAVRTMRWGGVILLAFIIYHLLHLTIGSPVTPEIVHGKVFDNIVHGFSNPVVVIFYVIAQFALGFHLAHGIWSLCRTLGMGNPRWDSTVKQIAIFTGIIITLGNISIPLAVLSGAIGGLQ